MSKQAWAEVPIVRKGEAQPNLVTGDSIQVRKEPRKEETLGRKRAWHGEGMEEPHKANYEITKRLAKKIETLKGWDKIDTIKDFVNVTLEKEADRLIAQAEKEGY